MARIFTWVAITHAGLLLAVTVMGVQARGVRRDDGGAAGGGLGQSQRDVEASADPTDAERAAVSTHVALAVFTLLLACLIHTVVFTYFTVTGKLIQQSLALGKFDIPTGMAPVKRRKAWVTRMLGASVAPIVLVVGTGAWGVEGVPHQRWHFAAGLLVTIVHLLAYPVYYARIVENARHLDASMIAYRERKETGSPRP